MTSDQPRMTPDGPRWRTSSRSDDSGNCVEVADNLPGVVLVRDSKDRCGPTLHFTPDTWRSFVTSTGTAARPEGRRVCR